MLIRRPGCEGDGIALSQAMLFLAQERSPFRTTRTAWLRALHRLPIDTSLEGLIEVEAPDQVYRQTV